ncbi:hypothetical protein [Streptomyces lasiicapitis]|uniref:Uncharacterized protein n=1 Tax=Streptomyces lasiicapitis TaxID=1923961 RepID=A0ABQ2MUL4_9ACTN|nr:hypothetical protein [Streptomyces lasiicapitis]GGO59086.1 hypothetical protein GCM10012286_79890 [Streptomyces lasiicapitis]
MNTTTLAAEFSDIGDNLFDVGTSWATQGLKLGLLAIVVITIIRKFSLKAGIGALIGLVVATGIYNGRNDLSEAFTNELLSVGAPAVHAPQYPGTDPGAASSAGGGRA